MRTRFFLAVTFLIFFSFTLFAGGQSESAAEEITVFNAGSTTDLVSDIASLFTEKTGIPVRTNPASSGTLAKQIQQGAEPDVYISASQRWMDYVREQGVVRESSAFVKNSLVLIAPADTSLSPFTLSTETDLPALFQGRLSMGDPAHVPAGKYAEEALTFFGWRGNLENRIQPAPDVRTAMSVVELGEAELGIVFATDAEKSEKVTVLARFPETSHTPINYFCALLEESGEAGKMFYEALLNDSDVRDICINHGFSIPE